MLEIGVRTLLRIEFPFLVPVFGLMIGAAFFGERLEVVQAAGVALVLIGILLVQRRAAAP